MTRTGLRPGWRVRRPTRRVCRRSRVQLARSPSRRRLYGNSPHSRRDDPLFPGMEFQVQADTDPPELQTAATATRPVQRGPRVHREERATLDQHLAAVGRKDGDPVDGVGVCATSDVKASSDLNPIPAAWDTAARKPSTRGAGAAEPVGVECGCCSPAQEGTWLAHCVGVRGSDTTKSAVFDPRYEPNRGARQRG